MSKHERFTTAVNDSTGDLIKTKASNQQAYADNWERIFGKKEAGKLTQDDVEVSVETPNGKVVVQGYVQEGIEQFIPFVEEYIAVPFTEQLLPSGIIEDEI